MQVDSFLLSSMCILPDAVPTFDVKLFMPLYIKGRKQSCFKCCWNNEADRTLCYSPPQYVT